jgi:calcineurin-like phosphoesterase family protein
MSFQGRRRIFFTSDTHFGHGNIIKYSNRPFLKDVDKRAREANGGRWHDGNWKGEFASDWKISRDAVDMMNDVITDNINAMVGEDDTLWHLGDWAFAQRERYFDKCSFYRNRIRCKDVRIIWGNHDEPHLIDRLFRESHYLHQIHVDGFKQPIVLCHYAMATWDKSHRGSIQLYGHSHTSAEPWLNQHMPGRRSMDVGVDNAYKLLGAYRPFSLEEIMQIMDKRSGFSMDHHVNPNAPTEEELMNRQSR